jgi:hypothetical protein
VSEKIFGIGLSKTGTTSLNTALTILGYKSLHWGSRKKLSEINLDYWEALTDIYLDSQLLLNYPNAKFILTVRDLDDWLNSFKKYDTIAHHLLSKSQLNYRKLVYGSESFNSELWKETYLKYYTWVTSTVPSENLLVLNIFSSTNSWEKLCNFLNKPIPTQDFPWENKGFV